MNATQELSPIAGAAREAVASELDRLLQGTYSPRYMLEGDSMDKMMRMAEQMASARVSIPEHLRGNIGDCLAIITQAMLWNMNPFAVAQKTHIVSGRLGYEAQLVNAVVQNSGAVRGAPSYEYRGEGNALECRVGFVLRGNSAETWNEWLKISDVTTKNSPLWKTNPKQQLGYLQIKNWARAYTPGAILGVYTTDELEQLGAGFPADADGVIPGRSAPSPAPAAPTLPPYSAADFAKNLPAWEKVVASGKKTASELLAMLQTKATFDEQQKAQILSLKAAPPPAEKTAEPAPPPAGDPWVEDMNAAEAQGVGQ